MGMESPKFRATPEASETEKMFGVLQFGPETSENFPNSKIFAFTNQDGEIVRYALSRSEDGTLSGSTFSLMEKNEGRWKNSAAAANAIGSENINVGPTYQMHQPELQKMEELLKERGINI